MSHYINQNGEKCIFKMCFCKFADENSVKCVAEVVASVMDGLMGTAALTLIDSPVLEYPFILHSLFLFCNSDQLIYI